MKKIIAVALISSVALSANAATWWYNGVLYGNVCRAGAYYTVYPMSMGQPVGTNCPVRDNYGNFIAPGYVSNE